MNAALTIAKREIRTYFNSPIAYIVLTVFLLLAGYLFFGSLFIERQAELRSYFNLMPLLLAFIVPAIAMRLISEGKLNVDLLTTHTFPLQDVEAGIAGIIDDPDSILGVVFEMG